MPRSVLQKWERIDLEEVQKGRMQSGEVGASAAGWAQKVIRKKAAKQVEKDRIADNQRLRAENAYLKKLHALVLKDEQRRRKRHLVIQMLRQGFDLNLLLSIVKLAHATYYYHAKRLAVPDKYADLVAEIKAIYAKNRGRYGYRRITDELHNRGHVVNHKTVQRLMRQHGIICCVRRKKYKFYKGEVGRITPNLLGRNFKADKPNQKWVTDVTEFSLFGKSSTLLMVWICAAATL